MNTLYVGNLGGNVTESDLRAIFSPYGTVLSCKFAGARRGQGKRFAYVEMASEDAAASALESLRGTELDGHRLDIVLENAPVRQQARPAFRRGRRR